MIAVGTIAFGSLLDDPGWERGPVIGRRDVLDPTPFRIEYARSSRSRDGAPTLVPVLTGGAAVRATVLVLTEEVDFERARDLLYRREVWWQTGQEATYRASGSTWIKQAQVPGVETALYTALQPNILGATPEKLAELAITSAQRVAGADRQDGINYLARAIEQGIETPLSAAYEAAILATTGTASLDEAWQRVRDDRAASS